MIRYKNQAMCPIYGEIPECYYCYEQDCSNITLDSYMEMDGIIVRCAINYDKKIQNLRKNKSTWRRGKN